VVDAEGGLVRDVAPLGRPVTLHTEVRDILMLGLRDAVMSEDGTAYEPFLGFPFDQVTVAGKTGTAEVFGKQDTAWFTALVPAENPQYVITVAVEQGDTGARTAAPIARKIIEYLYCLPGHPDVPPDPQYGEQPDTGQCAPQVALPPVPNPPQTEPTLAPAGDDGEPVAAASASVPVATIPATPGAGRSP
jgi:penicillin-binding protein 2